MRTFLGFQTRQETEKLSQMPHTEMGQPSRGEALRQMRTRLDEHDPFAETVRILRFLPLERKTRYQLVQKVRSPMGVETGMDAETVSFMPVHGVVHSPGHVRTRKSSQGERRKQGAQNTVPLPGRKKLYTDFDQRIHTLFHRVRSAQKTYGGQEIHKGLI